MAIRIFITGGTFDKEYDELNEVLAFKETHLQKMLTIGRCRVDVELRTLMLIDSLQATDADRDLIATNCAEAAEDKIIITHGTGTMDKTATAIAKKVKDKTVVLTGAMIPYIFGSSDGLFNLGTAIGFVQALPLGVYIVMNGKYFNWDNVRKNTKTGNFEEIK